MVSDTRGLWHADMIRFAAARLRGAKSATGVLGLVLTRWRLASTDAGRNEALGLHELERRRLQAGTLSGFVEYICLATAVLLSLVHHGIMDPRALFKILEPFEVELPPVEDGAPERLSVRTLITRWRHHCEVDILPVDCLMITPLLVGPILSGKASICHVVGVGQRVCRKRLLVHMPPTRGTLKRFRESALQQRRSKRTAPRVRGCYWRNMHDPRIVIDWLAATEHVKNINQAWFTARAFATIFAKRRQCDVSEVMGSTRRVHFETLRRARIR